MDVGGNTLLVWAHGPKVGPFMNGLHFFFGIGAFLAPIFIAQAVLLTGRYGAAYWLIGLLMLPLALILTRVQSPINHAAKNSADQKPFNLRLVVLLVIFFFLYVGAEVSFGGWVFAYATHLNLVDVTTASLITSAFWGGLTAGRLLGVPVSARLSPKTIIWIDLAGCVLSLGIILLFPLAQAALWAGTLLLGLSMASVFPTTLTLAEKRLHISGKITSWFFIGASLGGMVLPWVIGQVFEPLGPPVAMGLIFGDILLAILLYAFIK
jgi:fucose permease